MSPIERTSGGTSSGGSGIPTDGWEAMTGTLTYSSVDGPTGVVSTSIDLTGSIGVGMRVKFTQTTVKYFIVTAITSGTITLYGGTDYTLVNAAISSPYFSPVKCPLGFNTDPAKWSQTTTDTTRRNQTDPSNVGPVWYNIGSISLDVPIGAWRLYYEVAVRYTRTQAGATSSECYATLSTANNTEDDTAMSAGGFQQGAAANPWTYNPPVFREKFVSLAAKTTYYLNASERSTSGVGTGTLTFMNDIQAATIKATCAYL